ncbi:MAG: 2-hydroxymuconate tautomerase family protein [Selenomonadales bacterium]|nr:2-hydroxymuconate tautomerase family protein [Selenomonadales bacterium]
MPIVQIDFITGRTTEQKRVMVKKVTEAISTSIGCSEDAVTVVLREVPKENFAEGGTLLSDK